jgi:hypothetical protein
MSFQTKKTLRTGDEGSSGEALHHPAQVVPMQGRRMHVIKRFANRKLELGRGSLTRARPVKNGRLFVRVPGES